MSNTVEEVVLWPSLVSFPRHCNQEREGKYSLAASFGLQNPVSDIGKDQRGPRKKAVKVASFFLMMLKVGKVIVVLLKGRWMQTGPQVSELCRKF